MLLERTLYSLKNFKNVFGAFLLRQVFSCRDNLKVETTDAMGEILFKSVPEQG